MLFFLCKADHSRFVLTLENILSSERDRLTVEFRDSGFQSGECRIISLVPLVGRFRSEFPDSTITPNRLRSGSCLQLKQLANYICQARSDLSLRALCVLRHP